MTESPPAATVTTHNNEVTSDIIYPVERDENKLADREQPFRYGFDYEINCLTDPLDDLREKSHLCRQIRGMTNG